MKFRLLFGVGLSLILFSCRHQPADEQLKIAVSEYQDKVYASWLMQIIGTTYGLPYEFKFIDEPGPDSFPYGYSWQYENLAKNNAATSDDDTDIEYMYLVAMENAGTPEPSYAELREAWMHHVDRAVWCANRNAIGLMHAGYYPPFTGRFGYNPDWCQIDPNLTNEIWATLSPGMLDYAYEKATWAGRITADSIGIQPTQHYAVMYANAFFEKDIESLIDMATHYIGKNSHFGKVVVHMKQLHATYPNDWQKARQEVDQTYHHQLPYHESYNWPAIDATLNGAVGILALLYGQGDIQRTLDMACALGYDADNQAATMAGLLGIIHGSAALPDFLTYPIDSLDWDSPLNDTYLMRSRHDLPDASISDMAKRIARMGEQLILEQGGEKIEEDGREYYMINADARFEAPLELNPMPPIIWKKGETKRISMYGGSGAHSRMLLKGELPEGVTFSNDVLVGSPSTPGYYSFEISVPETEKSQKYSIVVPPEDNLAQTARTVLAPAPAADSINKSWLNDGDYFERTYYSRPVKDSAERVAFGYEWDEVQTVDMLLFNIGKPANRSGWLVNINVEYHDGEAWKPVRVLDKFPQFDNGNNFWIKPRFITYGLRISPVETQAIRLTALAGGSPGNQQQPAVYQAALSELEVY